MSDIDVPAKVLECFVSSQTGLGSWPFDDGRGDPYWQFGKTPRDYRWLIEVSITPQHHSSHKTRVPRIYNAMDVKVGDYIASTRDGTALKIIRIDRKSDTSMTCVVEDVFRYNTFRDVSGIGNGLFDVPSEALIFEVNDQFLPVVDPLPASGVSQSFYPNLMSRFHNLEKLSNFILEQKNHGFVVGQLISADEDNSRFVLTSDGNPYVIGTVVFINDPHTFTVEPIQQIVENMDFLVGGVADILYADVGQAGRVTTNPGSNPVMIKLRDWTPTVLRGYYANPTTSVGNRFSVNGVPITVLGTGTLGDVVAAVNAKTNQHGVVANATAAPATLTTVQTNLSSKGEVIAKISGGFAVRINGVTVNITSNLYGSYRYGDLTLAAAEDMAIDINAANIPGIVASVEGAFLKLTNTLGGGITVVNLQTDGFGNNFVGNQSITGMTNSAIPPAGTYLSLAAVDARAIDLANIIGSPLNDLGIYSVENGVKAAAIYIEQGLRKATNYVVPDIAGRNALKTIIGDTAYVIDKGDGQWGQYLYTGSTWSLTSAEEVAKVDSDTYTVAMSSASTSITLGRVSGGSKVTSITFEVTQAFNGTPSIGVGTDNNQTLLADDSGVDLTTPGFYVVTPGYLFGGSNDTLLKAYLNSGGASQGFVTVCLTYQ